LDAGASEKTLKRLSIPYRKVYIHAGHHAGYYPGAKTIDLKLLFSPEVRRGVRSAVWRKCALEVCQLLYSSVVVHCMPGSLPS
jgi:hypothetical protein